MNKLSDSSVPVAIQGVDPELIERLASSIDYLYRYFETIKRDGSDFEQLMLKRAFSANRDMPFSSGQRDFLDCINEITNQFQSLLNPDLSPIHNFLIERIEQQITFLLKIIRRQHAFLEPGSNQSNNRQYTKESALPKYKPVNTHDISKLTCQVGELSLTLERLRTHIEQHQRSLNTALKTNKTQTVRRIESTLDTLKNREQDIIKQLALAKSRLHACQLVFKKDQSSDC